jgi:hypothetical protein
MMNVERRLHSLASLGRSRFASLCSLDIVLAKSSSMSEQAYTDVVNLDVDVILIKPALSTEATLNHEPRPPLLPPRCLLGRNHPD